ncbi:MAG: hypothetical protein U5Q16_00100 [Gammaproteobacteria bacterium]|nr:hypothetical protein [Gammaproteobacteria bacterium]
METLTSAPSARQLERAFYTSMAVAMALVVVVGFARTFFLRAWFPDVPMPPEPIFLVHGVVFSAWMLLLVAQTGLIATNQVRTHRTVGIAGTVLAAAIVVMGVMAALVAARRPEGFFGVPVPPLQFLIVPLGDMVLFGSFAALAILWRRHPQTHKRLMLMATIALLTAAFARIPLLQMDNFLMTLMLANMFIVAMLAWDLFRDRRPHPVTMWAGAFSIVSVPGRLALSETAPWLAFAGWLTGGTP